MGQQGSRADTDAQLNELFGPARFHTQLMVPHASQAASAAAWAAASSLPPQTSNYQLLSALIQSSHVASNHVIQPHTLRAPCSLTLLQLAVLSRQPHLVCVLLQHGADIHSLVRPSHTAYHLGFSADKLQVSASNDPTLFYQMMQYELVRRAWGVRCTALDLAIKLNEFPCLGFEPWGMGLNAPMSPEPEESSGWESAACTLTALSHAAEIGYLAKVNLQLRAGADPNVCSGADQAPPLYYTLMERKRPWTLPLVRALLRYGADPNVFVRLSIYNVEGRAPLLMAALIPGNAEVFAALLEAGADSDLNNHAG